MEERQAGATLVLSVSKTDSKPADHAGVAKVVPPRVLIGDDQHDILTALSLLLKLNRFATKSVDSPAQVLDAARNEKFDLILMDLNYSRDTTSGREGLELLAALRHHGVSTPIVVMTAWGNVELAVEAMRLGANDFVQKPWDNQRLLSTISKQLDQAESARKRFLKARSELEIARHVQQKLFPQQLKKLKTLDYAAVCIPAREVGGDYYDFFDLGEGQMAGLLADVSGKGVAAAMLMANLQACFRTQLDTGARTGTELLEIVNRLFYASSPPEQYVTLFYFEYDDERRSLCYVNCGHLPPALLRRDGSMERLHATATVLGLFPHCSCECREIFLDQNDTLVLFTDGATEFLDRHGVEFGEDRLLALVRGARQLSPKSALQHITERLSDLSNGTEQFDDQTIMLMKAQ